MTNSTNAAVAYEKGTWQDSLNKSAVLFDRSAQGRKRASALLWDGAKAGIADWLPGASTDVSAENFYATVLDILGAPRKGDASKIKTVALAVRNNGLDISEMPNLSKAYAAAIALTKTAAVEAEEDDAADLAVEAIDAPKTASTVESAALVLLSKGVDGAVVAILDALGADNEAAHRSFMRAVSTEVSARVQAKADEAKAAKAAEQAAKKADAEAARAKAAEEKAAAKAAKAPAKSGATKAKPTATSKSKGDPNKKALPAKAKPATKAAPVEDAEPSVDDMFDEIEGVEDEAAEVPTPKAKPVRRGVPVKRPAK